MKKPISSEMTIIYKFIFPALWLGLFGLGTVAMMFGDSPVKWMFLTMLIIGSLGIAWLCFPLKRVSIDGADLVVSNFNKTCRIPLSDIHDVTENVMINIHPVWIHFRKPTDFGQKIIFMPTLRMFACLRSHPIVAELKQLAQRGETLKKSPTPLTRDLQMGRAEGEDVRSSGAR